MRLIWHILARGVPALALALVFVAASASAQGLTPMRKSGVTPGDTKGFYLHVINSYDRAMTFDLTPMETDLETEALNAVARPSRVRIPAGRARRIIFHFDLPAGERERAVSLCVMAAETLGAVAVRVCGTYTGRRPG